MLTERDLRILAWIGGLGAAGAEHVVERFAMDSATVYYLASRPAAVAVLRAVREMRVEEYVQVLALDGAAALVERECDLGAPRPGREGRVDHGIR